MNKAVVIVVAAAAVALVGITGLMVLNCGGGGGGGDPISMPPPLAPGDMREHNRKQIGELLEADRERGEAARRLTAGTQPNAASAPSTRPASR